MAQRRRPRRARFPRFIGTGALVGFLLAAAFTVFAAPTSAYPLATQLGYLGLLGAAVGGLAGAVLAVLLDRDS